MKKFLILPVLFSVLFLGGCSGYYSQDQVNALIQQQSAANQAQISSLTAQINNLQNTIDNFAQKASTTAGQIVGNDRDAHGCIGSAGYSWCEAKQKCLRPWEEACTTTLAASNQTIVTPSAAVSASTSDISTKGWLTLKNDYLNYQFKYPKDFFQTGPKVVTFDCDVNKFAAECPYFDEDINGYLLGSKDEAIKYGLGIGSKEINGHRLCTEERSEPAAGQLFSTHYYINTSGNQCAVLMYVVQTSNGCGMYDPGPDTVKCENYNNVFVPETISKIESTFSFK